MKYGGSNKGGIKINASASSESGGVASVTIAYGSSLKLSSSIIAGALLACAAIAHQHSAQRQSMADRHRAWRETVANGGVAAKIIDVAA